MQLAVRQINSSELTDFINGVVSGENFSGFFQAYAAASGWMGPTVIYGSGGVQTIYTVLAFQSSPTVPYSGSDTGSAVSQAFLNDKIAYYINSLSGTMTGEYLTLKDRNQTILGVKKFTGAVGVGDPILGTDATPLSFISGLSGFLQQEIDNVTVANAVTLNGDQLISGRKTFDQSPFVPIPTDPSGAISLSYVSTLVPTGVVHMTGDEVISGQKTFTQSPIVPLATADYAAVPKIQLDALGVSIGGISGFAGVASINGSTGAASGNVYLQGAGTVTVVQCGAVFTISGFTANLTQFYSAQIPLISGTTGLFIYFPTDSGSVFAATPTITDSLSITGGNGDFFGHYIYGPSITGFNVAFQSGIPSANYVYNFSAIPTTGQSGFFGLQGADGRAGASLNSRGVWQAGLLYSNLDWVYQPTVAASYVCTQTHISTSFNAPAGTGGSNWAILSSGSPGPTGAFIFQGPYNSFIGYSKNFSVSLSGSTYGFTGQFSSGISPYYQTGGWVLLAKAGDIGYFINSGIITGNFVNISFFLDPVNTGLNLGEAFVGYNFQYTGYALGCVTSGIQPDQGNFILTGSIYLRDFATNTKTPIQTFTLNTGIYNQFSGNFAYTITGLNRIGFDLTSTLSGISKLSLGLFGFGIA